MIEIAAFSKCMICLHPHVSQIMRFSYPAILKCSNSQIEHFSNGAILKSNISQMEHFSNEAILKSNISQMEQFSNGAFWGRHPMPYFKIPRTEKYGMRCASSPGNLKKVLLNETWKYDKSKLF